MPSSPSSTRPTYVTFVGAITLAVGIVVKRQYPRVPYTIAALFAGSLVAAGARTYPVSRNGISFRPSVPCRPRFRSSLVPPFSLESLRKTASIAVAVTMLGLTEAVSIARALALRSEQRIDGNQEFIGQGLSNIAASFFSSGLRLERLVQPQRTQLRSWREDTARRHLRGAAAHRRAAPRRTTRELPADTRDGRHPVPRRRGASSISGRSAASCARAAPRRRFSP